MSIHLFQSQELFLAKYQPEAKLCNEGVELSLVVPPEYGRDHPVTIKKVEEVPATHAKHLLDIVRGELETNPLAFAERFSAV